MANKNSIRSYDYVNHPYEYVKEKLIGDTIGIFQNATKSAALRAHNVAAELHINIAGIELGKDISIGIKNIDVTPKRPGSLPKTSINIEWSAAKNPSMFPVMNGYLNIYPLTATETQLDFDGNYEVPLGIVGGVLDSVIGHKIAEASVSRFMKDVAAHLRQEIK